MKKSNDSHNLLLWLLIMIAAVVLLSGCASTIRCGDNCPCHPQIPKVIPYYERGPVHDDFIQKTDTMRVC